MSTNMKLSKAQLSKIIQSGGFLSNMIGKLCKEALIKFAASLAKDISPQLATKATSPVINNLKQKCVEVKREDQEKDSLYSFRIKIWMILLES